MLRPLLIASVLCLAAAASSAQPAPAPQVLTPSELVESSVKEFVSSLNNDNVYFSAVNYVSDPRDYGYFGGPSWAKLWVEKRGNLKLEVDNVVVSNLTDSTAEARVVYHWKSNQPRLNSESITENLRFRLGQSISRPQKTWRIMPTAPPVPEVGPDGRVIVPATPPILNAVAQALADPSAAYAAEMAASSITNLKQLALAALQFMQDYDLQLAFNQDSMVEALKPYTGNKHIFTVPSTDEVYSVNENLIGKPGNSQIQSMHQVVMFYEGKNQTPIFRYGGKAAIAFADGHVKLVSREEAGTLVWEPVWKK
jgi:prepilin-type processing-associated H-X9-DG protein